jgi:broad specificity phosphatase PhoE
VLLYLIRHGETDFNVEGRASGLSDIPLNSVGVAQAEVLVPHLPSDAQAMYCSALVRTQQTADILNRKLNLPLNITPELNERDFGSLTGKSWDEIGEEIRKLDRDQKYDYHPYGGESVEDVHKRLLLFIAQIKADKAYDKVIIVATSGIIRSLSYLYEGYTPPNTVELKKRFGNSSVHKFEV